MRPIAAWVSVIALFLVGILIGSLATHVFYSTHSPDGPAPPGSAPRMFQDRMERRLDLTAEQSAQVAAILEQTRMEAHALREELRPRIDGLMDGTRDRVRSVLTPEQREKFDRFLKQHRRHSERFFLGGPPHRGRGGPPRGNRRRPPDAPFE